MEGRGPVTLPVKIYERSYDVQYPDQQKVKELMLEFATKCKGDKKPGANRRYFVCIYCGKDDFSNKLRLNQHRYEEGCPEAKYPDGRKALLLPYPDFLPGQGKMVQSLVKGVKLSSTTTEILQERTNSRTVGIPPRRDISDDDFDTCPNLPNAVLATKKRSSVTGQALELSGSTVGPRGDLLCGLAPPPKNGKAIGRTPNSVSLTAPKGKGRHSGAQVLQRERNAKDIVEVGAGREMLAGKRLSGEDSEDEAEQPRRSKRARCQVTFEDESAHVNSVPRRGDAKREAIPPCTLSRQTTNFECEGLDTLAWVSMPLSMGADEYHAGGRPLPVIASNANVTAKAETSKIPRGGATKLKLPKKGKVSGSAGVARLMTVPSAQHGRRGADKKTTVRVKEPLLLRDNVGDLLAVRGTDEDCEAAPFLEENAAGTKPGTEMVSFSGKSEGAMARDTGGKLAQDATVEEAMSSVVTWEVEFATNLGLTQYWIEGQGTPNPARFHPELEGTLLAREEVLRDFERKHLSVAQAKSDDRLSKLQPPAPPTEPPIPGLYYLRTFEDAVELPWSWDCDGGEDFRRKWDSTFLSGPFQESLMGCLWWWTAKKVSYSNNNPSHLKITGDTNSTGPAITLRKCSRSPEDGHTLFKCLPEPCA